MRCRRVAATVPRSRGPIVLLGILGLAVLAGKCGSVQAIRILAPLQGQLQVTSIPVAVAGQITRDFDPLSVEFVVDGIELSAALGVSPPFSGVAGVVMIGGEAVTVSGFSYDPTLAGTPAFAFDLAGLPAGDHALAVSGTRVSNGVMTTRTRDFGLADGFQQGVVAGAAAGLPGGPEALGASGYLASQCLGQAVAAVPISLGAAGTLRSGHVEAAEQQIAVGGP